jgi:predicted nuclease of restriction endonuclease-like (RecB) superfamily
MANIEKSKPEFVTRDGIIADGKYVEWLGELKQRYQRSQIKAAVQVNHSMLEFYWSLGRDIVALKAESQWGSGVLQQLSLDLKKMFPNEKGFSYRNIRYMRQWYSFYFQRITNWHEPSAKMALLNWHEHSAKIEESNRHQHSDGLDFPDIFALVPWKHHVHLVSKSNSIDEALFYIKQTIANNWSLADLEHEVKTDLFSRHSSALTNFSDTMTLPQQKLAQEVMKSPYQLGFLKLKQDHSEDDLEEALVKNITQFLLELGQGFAYVGRQMELVMPDGSTFVPDLVFYHTRLKCYIVVELKSVKFMPEFVGKLNFYVSAADELLRADDDKPTIGLLICREADKTTVEWAFRGLDRPLGVATYQIEQIVQRTILEDKLKKQKKNV